MFNYVLGSMLIFGSVAILYGYHQRKNILAIHADVAKALLSSYRPSDYLHVHYAKQAYQNSGEKLEALQPRVETSYRIAVDKLDRKNYVSYPNLVNTALTKNSAD